MYYVLCDLYMLHVWECSLVFMCMVCLYAYLNCEVRIIMNMLVTCIYIFKLICMSYILFQRVNQCLRDACFRSQIKNCQPFIDCGRGKIGRRFYLQPAWQEWINDSNSSSCFSIDGDFQYGIYQQAVNLTTKNSIVTRYVYSLFWGFQVFIFLLAFKWY